MVSSSVAVVAAPLEQSAMSPAPTSTADPTSGGPDAGAGAGAGSATGAGVGPAVGPEPGFGLGAADDSGLAPGPGATGEPPHLTHSAPTSTTAASLVGDLITQAGLQRVQDAKT